MEKDTAPSLPAEAKGHLQHHRARGLEHLCLRLDPAWCPVSPLVTAFPTEGPLDLTLRLSSVI